MPATDTVPDAKSPTALLPEDPSPQDELDARTRQQAVILAIGRRVVSRPNIEVLMQDAAALIAETLKVDLSGVARVSDDGNKFVLTTVASDEAHARLVGTHEYPIGTSESLAGFTIDKAQPTVSADLVDEPRFTDHFLLESCVVSAFAIPLHSYRDAYGALGFFCTERRVFSDNDIQFAETIAHLLATTMARAKAEAEVQQNRNLFDTVLDTVEACVLVLKPDGRIIHVNRTCEAWGAYPLDELADQPFWNVFLIRSEVKTVQNVVEKIGAGGDPIRFKSRFKPKNGRERSISWSSAVQRDANGGITSIVLTGVDITEQLVAEMRARKAQTAADETEKALRELQQQSEKTESRPRQIPTAQDAHGARAVGQTPRPFQTIPNDATGRERRSAPRRAYQYRQTIAPIVDGKAPKQSEFREVPFHDISAGGVSFVLQERPTFQQAYVQLGQDDFVSHLCADVVRVREIEYEGKPAYLVACKFTGRLRRSA